jgi:DDE domain
LSALRDADGAKRLFRKALSDQSHPQPRVINTDLAPIYSSATTDIKKEETLRSRCRHRPVQYLNNIIEQDHRAIKRRVNAKQGFREFQAARRTIQGYEAMNIIRKGQARWLNGRGVRRQKLATLPGRGTVYTVGGYRSGWKPETDCRGRSPTTPFLGQFSDARQARTIADHAPRPRTTPGTLPAFVLRTFSNHKRSRKAQDLDDGASRSYQSRIDDGASQKSGWRKFRRVTPENALPFFDLDIDWSM